MPCTTTQNTSTGMIILISLMKPSPSGLSLTAKSGKNRPDQHAEDQRDDDLTEERFGETGHEELLQ